MNSLRLVRLRRKTEMVRIYEARGLDISLEDWPPNVITLNNEEVYQLFEADKSSGTYVNEVTGEVITVCND